MTPKMPDLFTQYEGQFMEVHFAFGEAGQGKSIGYLRRKLELIVNEVPKEFWVIVTEPAVGGEITTEVALDAANIVMLKIMDVEAYKLAVEKAKEDQRPSGLVAPGNHPQA